MKKKTYKEQLLWSIIIILVMFIVVLDVYWFREKNIEKVQQEDTQKATGVVVTLDFNGGYYQGSYTAYSISVTTTDTYSQLTFWGGKIKKEGYTFAGWYYGGIQVHDGEALKSNSAHTLYAQWSSSSGGSSSGSSSSSAITLTLDYNDGTGKKENLTMGAIPSAYGAFHLPTPTRERYTFEGWYYGSEKVDDNTALKTSSNHTLTAKWTYNGPIVTVYINNNSERKRIYS